MMRLTPTRVSCLRAGPPLRPRSRSPAGPLSAARGSAALPPPPP